MIAQRVQLAPRGRTKTFCGKQVFCVCSWDLAVGSKRVENIVVAVAARAELRGGLGQAPLV